MAKLDFIPLCCSFLDSSRQALSRLAISDNESSKIYIYDGKSKILQIFHENLDFYKQLHERLQLKQQDNEDKKSNIIILNNVEYSRRLTIVKDLEKYSIINPLINFQFNSSDTFIFYSIFYGIKMLNLRNNSIGHCFGTTKKARFIRLALYQSNKSTNQFNSTILFSTAYKK
ncbi:unnamed protein product [Rotaria magnacalcarata]